MPSLLQWTNAITRALITVSVLLLASACEHTPPNKQQTQVEAIKGVDVITETSNNNYNIYCATGICRFDVKSQGTGHIRFNFFYREDEPFRKLEGVHLSNLGDEKDVNEFAEIRDNQTSILYNTDEGKHWVQIQIIDFYR